MPSAAGTGRFMTALQLAGSLFAIPIGLASAYTIYHANFSPDATCQSLRANILATLDKDVDVATRRMLVHRDVAAFESGCGAIDPEAVAAFKRLLVTDKNAAPLIVATPHAERRPQEVARQNGTRVASAAPERPDAAASDTAWMKAVRQALLTGTPAHLAHTGAAKRFAATPIADEPRPLDILATSGAKEPAVSASAAAPASPQVKPLAADLDHPVPPGLIPEASTGVTVADARAGSSLSGWVARIPLVGPMIAGQSR